MRKRFMTANQESWEVLKHRSREMRHNPTIAEKIIWSAIRKRAFGYSFRRQHVIGYYIVDFLCLECKVILEIDGESHDNKQEYDTARDEYLEGLGYHVLHITNEEVLSYADLATQRIIDFLKQHSKKCESHSQI
jgi:very-short-patch-repair endonuclease